MINHKLLRISSLAALLVIAAGGCSATDTQAETKKQDPGQVQAAATNDPLALAKVEEFLKPNGPAEQARQVVIRRCMNNAGFDWTVAPEKPLQVEDLLGLKPLSVEEARTKGYSEDVSSTPAEGRTPQEPGAQEAFMGPSDAPKVSVNVLGMSPSVPSGGCLAESFKEIYGSIENGMMATGVSANAVLPAINAGIADQSIADANKDWQKCMENSGQPNLATPDLAWDEARKNPDRAGTIALADAKCRDSINYEETRKASLNKYLTTFLTSNEAIITEIQGIRQTGATNAQRILAGR